MRAAVLRGAYPRDQAECKLSRTAKFKNIMLSQNQVSLAGRKAYGVILGGKWSKC